MGRTSFIRSAPSTREATWSGGECSVRSAASSTGLGSWLGGGADPIDARGEAEKVEGLVLFANRVLAGEEGRQACVRPPPGGANAAPVVAPGHAQRHKSGLHLCFRPRSPAGRAGMRREPRSVYSTPEPVPVPIPARSHLLQLRLFLSFCLAGLLGGALQLLGGELEVEELGWPGSGPVAGAVSGGTGAGFGGGKGRESAYSPFAATWRAAGSRCRREKWARRQLHSFSRWQWQSRPGSRSWRPRWRS